jgi:hypothetical protein
VVKRRVGRVRGRRTLFRSRTGARAAASAAEENVAGIVVRGSMLQLHRPLFYLFYSQVEEEVIEYWGSCFKLTKPSTGGLYEAC